MYKDLRVQASTPEHWDSVFMPQRNITLNTLYRKIFDLNRTLFDPQWREISRRVKQGSRVLDAGCGMGQWVMFLRQHDIDAVGLDYSAAMVTALKARYPEVEWMQGSIQDLPLPDQSVDGIISWGVIEHDEAVPQQALKEFYRVLKPNGTVFVTVPCDTPAMRHSSEFQTAQILQAQPGQERTFYQYFMTEKELECFLTEAQFRVEIVKPTDRHYAVVFPRGYLRLRRFGQMGEAVTAQILRPYLMLRRDSHSMILGVGRKVA